MKRRKIRWRRVVGAVAAFATVSVAWLHGPRTLREADTFRVRQVEVVGTRFLEPYAVVRAAGLDRAASIFDDADAWRAGVRTLALVDDVTVRRVFPSRIQLEVREVEPVALIAAGSLRPVDAAGRLLELDPAGIALDLPVLTGVVVDGGRVVEGPSRGAVETVAALLSTAPGLAENVSQADLEGRALRLTFREREVTAVLTAGAGPVELTQLRLAMADLTGRGELEQVRTIDVRFRDQVVVSFLHKP